MKQIEQYTKHMDMSQFKRIDDISKYNSNYYIGIDKDLLYGCSNDDTITEWYLIIGRDSYYLGYSYDLNCLLIKEENL